MTIKEQTIIEIEKVLAQNKKYYRSSEFPFPTHNGNYSTHQGAVLRYYLRENGYVNVRVSEISTQFFIDNQDSINKSLKGQPLSNIFLKPSNTIIMKAIDYSFYMVDKPKPVVKPKIQPRLTNVGDYVDSLPKKILIYVYKNEYLKFKKTGICPDGCLRTIAELAEKVIGNYDIRYAERLFLERCAEVFYNDNK